MGDGDALITRRAWLASGAALAGAAAAAGWRRWAHWLGAPPPIEGSIVGAAAAAGHRLRGGAFPAPVSVSRAAVAVVGGGISGLSAGWGLDRRGIRDWKLLELDAVPGGNARWGEGPVTDYPWGAHYIPFPGPEAGNVSALLRDLGVETGRDAAGRPVYDERYVCHAPQERLFVHARWQEGLYPRAGATEEDLRQFAAFEASMDGYRRRRGADGRRAFAIPMERSSRDPELLALDRLTMAAFLDRHGWTSPRLRWYVDYAMRDDYGCRLEEASAWAGVHYFAARGTGDDDQVLTWPEGNGWVARRLASAAGGRLTTSALVFDVDRTPEGVRVDWLDLGTGQARRLLARQAIVCLPRFVARRVVAPLRGAPADGFTYSPWVVANLTVEDPPAGRGAPPSWDNVIYGSESLGYVSANHQRLDRPGRRAVWTWYLPLASGDPDARRREALAAPWSRWRDLALDDLAKALPGLRDRVRRLDVMVWGHAMPRPVPGLLWGGARERAAASIGPIHFGHSDLSGLSLFEEAQDRALRAVAKV